MNSKRSNITAAQTLQVWRSRREQETAFTLVELLVVILIIGILLAIALPTFLNQQDKANNTKAEVALGTVYKAASSDAVSRGAEYVNGETDLTALKAELVKGEPELSFAVSSATLGTIDPTTMTANTVYLTSDTTARDLKAADLSASGDLCTLSVVGHGKPDISCSPVTSSSNGGTDPGSGGNNSPAPTPGFTTSNGTGNTPGLVEQGDQAGFIFPLPPAPGSIVPGWDGSTITVQAQLWSGSNQYQSPNLVTHQPNDVLLITVNNQPILGWVDLGSDAYTPQSAGGAAIFGTSAAPSTMVLNGDTITVTLGGYTANGVGIFGEYGGRSTAVNPSTAVWHPQGLPGADNVFGSPIYSGSPTVAKDAQGNPFTDADVSSTNAQLYF